MKRLFFFIAISIFFISCSNVAEGTVEVYSERTLKDVIGRKEGNITWAKELEEDRLTKNIYNDEYISSGIALSPEVVAVVRNNEEPVYPELPGFGSLDTRGLTENIRNITNNFCRALSKNVFKGPISFFDKKFVFNYVFFRNDLIEGWDLKFGRKFPQEDNDKWQPPLFDKWILGRPFVTEDIIEQPVRFYKNQQFIDVTIYIRLDNNKIYQITIDDVE